MQEVGVGKGAAQLVEVTAYHTASLERTARPQLSTPFGIGALTDAEFEMTSDGGSS